VEESNKVSAVVFALNDNNHLVIGLSFYKGELGASLVIRKAVTDESPILQLNVWNVFRVLVDPSQTQPQAQGGKAFSRILAWSAKSFIFSCPTSSKALQGGPFHTVFDGSIEQ
jgi:hypothetical protein